MGLVEIVSEALALIRKDKQLREIVRPLLYLEEGCVLPKSILQIAYSHNSLLFALACAYKFASLAKEVRGLEEEAARQQEGFSVRRDELLELKRRKDQYLVRMGEGQERQGKGRTYEELYNEIAKDHPDIHTELSHLDSERRNSEAVLEKEITFKKAIRTAYLEKACSLVNLWSGQEDTTQLLALFEQEELDMIETPVPIPSLLEDILSDSSSAVMLSHLEELVPKVSTRTKRRGDKSGSGVSEAIDQQATPVRKGLLNRTFWQPAAAFGALLVVGAGVFTAVVSVGQYPEQKNVLSVLSSQAGSSQSESQQHQETVRGQGFPQQKPEIVTLVVGRNKEVKVQYRIETSLILSPAPDLPIHLGRREDYLVTGYSPKDRALILTHLQGGSQRVYGPPISTPGQDLDNAADFKIITATEPLGVFVDVSATTGQASVWRVSGRNYRIKWAQNNSLDGRLSDMRINKGSRWYSSNEVQEGVSVLEVPASLIPRLLLELRVNGKEYSQDLILKGQ